MTFGTTTLGRRGLLLSLAGSLRGAAAAKASQPRTRIGFRVPPGACDCHTHIFGDASQFPFSPTRRYTPAPALPSEMKMLHKAMHVERVVIVQPSVYGTDNRATLWGMSQMGGLKHARGIAVIDAATSESELRAMDKAGIRGVRLNAEAISVERFREACTRARALDWHVQINTGLTVVQALKSAILESPVPVVIDHVAGALPARGAAQAGFADLVELVRSGKAYVKVTHRFLSTSKSPMFEDAEVLARALLRANPERVLWGTDWPHPGSSGDEFDDFDDGRLFNHSASWCELNLRTVLVENPARLYRF